MALTFFYSHKGNEIDNYNNLYINSSNNINSSNSSINSNNNNSSINSNNNSNNINLPGTSRTG